MTAIMASPPFTVANARKTVVSDPGTTKTALVCGTVAFGAVVTGFAYIMTHGGDAVALATAISLAVTSISTAVASVFKRKAVNGESDA